MKSGQGRKVWRGVCVLTTVLMKRERPWSYLCSVFCVANSLPGFISENIETAFPLKLFFCCVWTFGCTPLTSLEVGSVYLRCADSHQKSSQVQKPSHTFYLRKYTVTVSHPEQYTAECRMEQLPSIMKNPPAKPKPGSEWTTICVTDWGCWCSFLVTIYS